MPDKVTVMHSTHGAANAVMALGVTSGCFEEEGIEVEMKALARTGLGVDLVLAGEADFAVSGAAPIINAARAGRDPVILMSIESENVFGVIGARGVTSPDMLKGRPIAISGSREQDDIIMRRTLTAWGIDADRDVVLEVRGSRGKCWDAVVSGEAVAMTATIPQPILARAVGLPILKDYTEHPEPYQAGAIVIRRSYGESRPELVSRFLQGQLRAVRLFQSDFAAALPHLKERSRLDDVEVLRETWRLFAHAIEQYVPNPAALGAVVEAMEAAYGETIPIDINRIIDSRLATALEGRPAAAPYVRSALGARA